MPATETRETSSAVWRNRANQHWLSFTPAQRVVVACLLLLVATVPVLSRLAIGRTADDIRLFARTAQALVHGPRIYRDLQFEYPPYVLPWFLPPYLFSRDLAGFRLAFGLEIWAIDAAIKAVLLWLGLRSRVVERRTLAPFFVYALGTAALGHFLLQRFDLIPAALAMAAVLTAQTCPLASGVLVVVSAGTKVYPALLFPVLLAFSWGAGRSTARRFMAGAVLAAIPLIALAAWAPWWNFAAFHVARGLHADSLLASIVWSLHFLGAPARWDFVGTSSEVTGPLAAAVLGPGRLLWVGASLAAVVTASLAAFRLGTHSRAVSHSMTSALACVALLPVAAFVATNTVLSPQFHLWLLPLAALVLFAQRSQAEEASSDQPRPDDMASRAAMCIFIATLLVPTFYPSPEYGTGLGVWRTAILLLRNGLLLYATVCLWIAVRRPASQTTSPLRISGST